MWLFFFSCSVRRDFSRSPPDDASDAACLDEDAFVGAADVERTSSRSSMVAVVAAVAVVVVGFMASRGKMGEPEDWSDELGDVRDGGCCEEGMVLPSCMICRTGTGEMMSKRRCRRRDRGTMQNDERRKKRENEKDATSQSNHKNVYSFVRSFIFFPFLFFFLTPFSPAVRQTCRQANHVDEN